MKKLALFTVIAGGLALASCSKDRTCNCVSTSDDGMGNVSSLSYDTVFQDMSKSDAKAACDGLDLSFSFLGASLTNECELN
jgi:outer membrane murein-binding lipoprotein Lpp